MRKKLTAAAVAGLLVSFVVEARAQDMPVGARAKGMGGSYTAFGDDATSIWYNPAGLATQRSKIAISYQSIVTYEFADTVPLGGFAAGVPGKPYTSMADPAFIPAFAGVVLALGGEKQEVRHAFSLAYVAPLNVNLTWEQAPGSVPPISIRTKQKFSRLRLAYAIDYKFDPDGAGFFPHAAAGAAVDWGATKFEMRGFFIWDEEQTALGYAGGALLTVYDNREWFSLDLGASYNSRVDFSFNLDQSSNPIFDWPESYSIGVAVYVYALKFTADVQWVSWKSASGPSMLPGVPGFDNTFNVGLGAEYSHSLSEALTVLGRLGYRRFDAPWGTKDPDTTVVGTNFFLTIDTKGEAFHLFSAGAGLYWSTPEGLRRGIDIAAEFAGDAITFAVSYIHEF